MTSALAAPIWDGAEPLRVATSARPPVPVPPTSDPAPPAPSAIRKRSFVAEMLPPFTAETDAVPPKPAPPVLPSPPPDSAWSDARRRSIEPPSAARRAGPPVAAPAVPAPPRLPPKGSHVRRAPPGPVGRPPLVANGGRAERRG